jgi:undecaprenyl-diphosphatase
MADREHLDWLLPKPLPLNLLPRLSSRVSPSQPLEENLGSLGPVVLTLSLVVAAWLTYRFDWSLLSFINRFVGRSRLFDEMVVYVSDSGFIRGGIPAALLWWAWFDHEGTSQNKDARERIASAIVACVASVCVARVIALVLPFRERPIGDLSNGLHFPAAMINWGAWSSFPSDHAIMFFTLTTCLFFISRTLGWIALVDTVCLVCLPRIYIGVHYPSDIVAGAAIGVAVGFISNRRVLRGYIGTGALKWMRAHPGSFYAALFLFTFQLTVLFWDALFLAKHLPKVLLTLIAQ